MRYVLICLIGQMLASGMGCSEADSGASATNTQTTSPSATDSIDQRTPDALVRSFLQELQMTKPDPDMIRRMLSERLLRHFMERQGTLEFWIEGARRSISTMPMDPITPESVVYKDEKWAFIRLKAGDEEGIDVVKKNGLWYWNDK